MYTITKDVFKFNELSDSAKQTAIDAYRDVNAHHEWWQWVYDDAANILEIMGVSDVEISFSGFWSQGDGACFTGKFQHNKGNVKALKAYAPKDKELASILTRINKIQSRAFYKLAGTIGTRGRYCHAYTMYIADIYHTEHGYNYDIGEAESELLEAFQDMANWIYKRLENEYNYLTSDEIVAETIIANDYEFEEYGNTVL